MSDLTVTPGNVALVPSNIAASKFATVIETGLLGATVTAGQLVYKDTADGRFRVADANSAHTAPVVTLYGMALNGGSSGAAVAVLRGGVVNPGATLVAGQTYVLSATSGGGNIAPVTDLTTGWWTNILGVATTTSNLIINITAAAVQHA